MVEDVYDRRVEAIGADPVVKMRVTKKNVVRSEVLGITTGRS